MNTSPPRWIIRFLEWFCPDYLLESILGDILEDYEHNLKNNGVRKADCRLFRSTLGFFRPYYLIKKFFRHKTYSTMLFGNYLTITFRRFRKEKLISAINIVSLAVGLTATLIIVLYIKHELSYDQFQENNDRIVRVTREWFNEEGQTTLELARVAAPIGPLLEQDFPEVQLSARLWAYDLPLKLKNEYFPVDNGFYFGEPSILAVFSFRFIEGNPETVLEDPNSIIISEQTANKYFPDESALGKSLEESDGTTYIITGIFEDLPVTSHIPIDFIASWSTLREYFSDDYFQSWGSNNYLTYLLLTTPSSESGLNGKLKEFMTRHKAADNYANSRLHLQKLTDIHLHSHLNSEISPNGNVRTVYLLGSIVFVVLVLACFNFINLSTSKGAQRSKEIGLRKVFGARRKQLIQQFLGEAIITSLLALVLAVGLTYILLPHIDQLLHRPLRLFDSGFWFNLLLLSGILIITGLLAGSYPAFVLSAFNPVRALRKKWSNRSGSLSQKSIVVVQFAVSVALTLVIITLYRQIKLTGTMDLGFTKEQIMVLPAPEAIRSNYQEIKKSLEEQSRVSSVSISKFIPSDQLVDNIIIDYETGADLHRLTGNIIPVGHDYFLTYGIDLLAGHDFREGMASDSSSVIVNESFVHAAGYTSPEEALGKKIVLDPQDDANGSVIIGVAHDIYFESLHKEITPVIFAMIPRYFRTVSVKFNASETTQMIGFAEALWKTHMGNDPFSYEFVDENFRDLYENERATMTLLFYLSILAISIACAGLMAIAIHTTEGRRKEICVRKVVGATEWSVSWLMIRRFLLLVIIALIIGIPVGFIISDSWLNTFIYHVRVDMFSVVMASLLMLFLSLTAVVYHSVKASFVNPSTVLTSEA